MWFFLVCYFITVIFGSEPQDGDEMVQFQLDRFVSHNQLEFSLSGERYKIQLVANHDLIHDESTETCHYFGYILEPSKYENSSNLALSLCPNRGIRGSITTHEKTIFIMPSSDNNPKLTDNHLVSQQAIVHKPQHLSRHLLGSYDRNKVELYVMADPAYVKMFKDKYSTNWKSELKASTQDTINQASAEFSYWNWGQAGKIELAMITLEIVEDFTGIYTNLRPPWSWSGCQGSHWSRSDCKIDGVKYLQKFRTFHKENNRYGDDHVLFSRLDFQSAQGWGGLASICTSRASALIDSPHFIRRIKTTAHEIGHNFDMNHDAPLVGIMGNAPKDLPKKANGMIKLVYDPISGKGDFDLRKIGWSSTSYNSLNAFFKRKNGLSCLKDGVRGFKTIHNPGSSHGGSSSGGSSGGSSSGGTQSCIEIRSLASNKNGEWMASGTINGKKKYKNPNNRGHRWMYWTGRYWTMNADYNSPANADNYCVGATLTDCSGRWKSWGQKVTNSRFANCGSFNTDEGLECLEGYEYNDNMCLYHDEDGYKEFTIADMCFNDKPVYEYVSDDISYYLYSDVYYEYFGNNSNATVDQWIISLDELASQDIVATCDESDVLRCLGDKWQVLSEGNDTLKMVIVEEMNIKNGKCGNALSSSAETSTTVIVWICAALAFVVLLSMFAFFIFRRSKQSKKAVIGDDSEEEEEEDEEEVEVEVDTKLTETTR